MLKTELKDAIDKYIRDKKDGTVENFIKNINATRRFSTIN